jgi:predicted metalloendopeptidase
VALESMLAEAQWSEVENRNAAKTYNKIDISQLPGFYEAFTVKSGDKMYLPPERRVTIW